MKKYLIIILIFFFSAGAYYVSGFNTLLSVDGTLDTVITGKSGVSNVEVSPDVQNPGERKSTDCSGKCKCKCKCKSKCDNKEVPLGENPYLNDPDTASNRIQPQEEEK